LTGGVAGFGGNKQVLDSDSDLDDFNYVLNETERQLYKARQSLEKKKRQQPFALNDRNLRKYVNDAFGNYYSYMLFFLFSIYIG
jgi:hypothetical protein